MTPAPQTEVFRPVTALKSGPHGHAVLVQEAGSGELMVARQVPVPDGQPLATVVAALQQAPSFETGPVGLAPVLAVMSRQRQVWVVSPFVPGYPLDYAAGQTRIPAPLVLTWTRQLLEAVAFLHGMRWTLGTLEPSDVVVGLHGATLVDLHLYEHAFPQRAALSRLNRRPMLAAPELSGTFTPTAACDVWSVAALACWLLTAAPPAAERLAEVSLPPAALSTLLAMLAVDPLHRPAAAEAVEAFPADGPASVYQVLPLVNVQVPVPWLDPSLMVAQAAPTDDLTATGRRLRQTTGRAAPPPAPPAPARLPLWAAPIEWLDDWTWVLFHGDGRKVAASALVLLVALLGLASLGRSGGATAASRPRPAPVSRLWLRSEQSPFYQRQGQGWQLCTGLSADGDVLAPREGALVSFGHGSRVVLAPGTRLRCTRDGQTYRFAIEQGRLWTSLAPSDTMVAMVGESRARLGGTVELDARAHDRQPQCRITNVAGSVSLQAGEEQVTVPPGESLLLDAGLPSSRLPAPATPDPWETRVRALLPPRD